MILAKLSYSLFDCMLMFVPKIGCNVSYLIGILISGQVDSGNIQSVDVFILVCFVSSFCFNNDTNEGQVEWNIDFLCALQNTKKNYKKITYCLDFVKMHF